MVIVAAVDRSNRAPDVVREAQRLARTYDEPVHFVHALTRSEFVNLGMTNAQTGEPLDIDQIRAVAADMVEETLSDISVPDEAVGLVGEPADTIVDYADERDARYIVVSPRKRSPTGKALFGSVARSILLHADCPVVAYNAESE